MFFVIYIGKVPGKSVQDCTLLITLGTVQTHIMRPVKTSICKDFNQTEKTKNRSRRHKEEIQSSPSHAAGQREYWSEELFIPSQCSLFQISVTLKS